MLVRSVVLEAGVNVPVHVMLSDEVMVANVPAGHVTSSALEKPVAAEEKTIVRVGVSPVTMSVSPRPMLLTVGFCVSTS